MNFFASLISLSEIVLFLCLQTGPVLSEGNWTRSLNLAPRLANFKTSVHTLLEGMRIRKKRRIQLSDELFKPETPNHQLGVGKMSREYGLSYLSKFSLTFWISFEHQSKNHILIGTQLGEMILFELSDTDDREATTVAVSAQEHIASKAMAFQYFDEQWFVVLQSNGESSWIRIYQRVVRGLEGKQSILLDGEIDFDLITVKGVHYLAVVTYRTAVHQSVLTLYEWTKTQFDKKDSRSVMGARSISCWALDGSLYMVVAQEANEEGDYRVGSPLFLYNAKDDEGLVLLQMLNTYGPRKVQYFFVSGTHYVIFFGQENAVIYWWSSDQFLYWQRIEGTANALDAAVLSLAYGEAMIAIALNEEAYFYAQDFSGRYIRTFSMSLPGQLASLQFIFSGKSYYALASYKEQPQSAWKLILDYYPMPNKGTYNPLQQCLLEVAGLADEREIQIEEALQNLGRVWLKYVNQTISAEVVVLGHTSSPQDSAITVLLVVTDHKVLPDTSIPQVEMAISNVKSNADGIQQSIEGSVRKSGEQKIIGSKHFAGALTIPSLNLRSTSVDVPINGIHMSRIYHFALKKYGNQTFQHPLKVNHISSGNVWTTNLNGIPANDLLLLGGEQIVTGILTFFDIITQDVFVRNVNSIPVESFVTTNSDQIIKDLKNITMFRSHNIDVHGQTNGVDLQEFSRQVVTILDDGEITAQCTVVSTLEMNNFFLRGLLNKLVNFEQLATYSVFKHTEQTLKGPFVFQSQLDVLQNLDVLGNINGIHSSHLVTVSTDQIISGNIGFEETLTINLDLISDNINGIDLDKTAIKKTTEPQFVEGLVTFIQQITANEILMTDFVELDTVDPSLLVQNIVNHEEGVVTSHETIFHDVIVLGNLMVSEGVNGYAISDLPTTVWLKSRTQTVDVPIHLYKVTAQSDMEVTSTVNTFNLHTDIVHSHKTETIQSVKTFMNEIVVPNHVNTNNVVFNGLDLVSVEDELDHIPNDGKIHGKKTLQTLEIQGDIAAGLFNDLKVKELMHPTIPQEVKGEVEFLSDETVIQNVLYSDTVNSDYFGGIHLGRFIDKAVVKVPKYAIKNKRFWTLEAQHMILNEGSTLGGVNFSGMLGRIVTVNTPQEISVPKTFMDYVTLETPSRVYNLNGKPWNEIVGNVVLVDESSSINSSKVFLENVKAEDVTVRELVSSVNITQMTMNAFLKSRDNVVRTLMIFLNDITVGNIDVKTTIDGLSWNDLIYTHQNEKLETVLFMSDVVLAANMQIGGLLNECDLMQIKNKGLYGKKTIQYITEKVVVKKLNIIGNLNVKEEVNHISIEDLQRRFVTIAGDQVITSDVEVGSNVKVVVLNLVDLMNDVDVTGIMNDAVRHSIPQEISGLKNFDVLMADILTANELFIIESLDDIDLNEVFNNAVWKSGDQLIDGQKTFSSLKSNIFEVQGFINGLRLPEGVVLTDTSDRITGSTTFKSDITLGRDIVIDGEINGTNLLHFILNRVTLSGDQAVSSRLSFEQDVLVRGDLLVDETVNNVSLDLVCKVKPAFPLEGLKTFVDFYIDGSLSVSSVNGYDVQKMDRGILRFNRDETLNELQVFENSLEVQNSLLTGWINGKSLSDMVNSFLTIAGNYNKTSIYFNYLSDSLIQHIHNQLQASVDPVTSFAYLILVQEIDLGPTTKILYGHDLSYQSSAFSHSMVIWTEKKCAYLERCCHQEFSYWMRVKKSGNLMIDATPETGKYYPIQNPAVITVDKDFVFWTDLEAVQSKWCNSSRSGELLLASLKEYGGRDIFITVKSAPLLSEVKSFWRGQHLYAVAGYYFDRKEDEYSPAIVYVFNNARREWRERQYLRSYGVLSLDITHNKLKDEILLAIGTGMGTYSSVYKWNDEENKFELLQNIPPKYVTSTLWLKQGSVQLLAMSSVDHWPKREDCSKFLSGGQVDIYVYEQYVKWIQSIPLRGVVSMISLTLAGDTFLVAASHQLQTIFIYEWKGYAGFSLIQSMFVGEVRHLNTYSIEGDIFITVAVTNGPSKLLKVVLQGKHALTVPIRKTIVPRELKDEATKDQKVGPRC